MRTVSGAPALVTSFLLALDEGRVDEAGAQFVGETVGLVAGIGVTLAIIRKGRILFWTAIGLMLIVKRGLSIREIQSADVAGRPI